METRVHSIHHQRRTGGIGSKKPTINPTRIQGLAGIPPAGAKQTGLSPEGQVDVYSGTLPGDIDAAPTAYVLPSAQAGPVKRSYGPPLPTSTVQQLRQQAAPYLDPKDDASLQQTFWPHVYNELPGTGTRTYRLQVITGTNDQPNCVQVSGTVKKTKLEPDGDLHVTFTPDDSKFPANADGNLEVEIIYAGPVTQADAKQAEQGYSNPFDISQLTPNTHIRIAGPLIYDTAHGKVDANGNITEGLEIHPVANLSILPA